MEARALSRDRTAGAIALVLALVVLFYIVSPFLPGMALWGTNLLRFLPAAAWVVVALAALAVVPGVATRGVPAARALGGLIARRPVLASCTFGGAAALLVLAFPDNARFVGDFLMRQGTVETAASPNLLFPQALPLDVALHYRIPRALSASHLLEANAYGRALGALEAFALGALAVAFVRALALEGSAACAAACAVLFTGALGLLTGYSKAFSELVLLTVAVGAFGVRTAREGRGVPGLLLAGALGLALHRSALALLPAIGVALLLAARDAKARARLRAPAVLVGYAALAVALGLFLPAIVRTATGFDMTQHFASEDVARQGGLLAAAFGAQRLLDLANALVFLTPLAPLVVLAAVPGRPRDGRVSLVLGVLFLSWCGVALAIFPAQGTFRDWDVFAAWGMATAALAAWGIGRAIALERSRGWLAVTTSLTCLCLTVLGLWVSRDRDRGWARVEAFIAGPPARTAVERTKTWDYLGASWYKARRYGDAERAYARAAETSRSQRMYLQWAMAAQNAGHLAESQRVFRELAGFAPGTGAAWQGLGSVSWQIGDYAEAARAARRLADLSPGDPEIQGRAQYVEGFYRAWKDSVEGRSITGPFSRLRGAATR